MLTGSSFAIQHLTNFMIQKKVAHFKIINSLKSINLHKHIDIFNIQNDIQSFINISLPNIRYEKQISCHNITHQFSRCACNRL